jgi:hypothetical protein
MKQQPPGKFSKNLLTKIQYNPKLGNLGGNFSWKPWPPKNFSYPPPWIFNPCASMGENQISVSIEPGSCLRDRTCQNCINVIILSEVLLLLFEIWDLIKGSHCSRLFVMLFSKFFVYLVYVLGGLTQMDREKMNNC